jgi:hypothetical protein
MTTQYYMIGGQETSWIAINATTDRGAKMVAGKSYFLSVNGLIAIGRRDDDRDEIYTVAVRRGYGAWQRAV